MGTAEKYDVLEKIGMLPRLSSLPCTRAPSPPLPIIAALLTSAPPPPSQAMAPSVSSERCAASPTA